MSPAEWVAVVMVGTLTIYVLMGGADFGGGVWDLFARGPRAEEQRQLIASAIGPIWEANHVWLIVVVVLLFTSFPPAFSLIMTELHIPITLMLVGIVMRGSSFVFRKADPRGHGGSGAWQKVFAISSLLTPVMIGVVLGAVTVPGIGAGGLSFVDRYVAPWLQPFPWAVGVFTLAIFSWLAACYLTLETEDTALTEDFRVRAFGSGWAVAVAGALVVVVGLVRAPEVVRHFGAWPGVVVLVTGALAWMAAQGALATRRYVAARMAAGLTVVAVLVGWAVGQYPYLVADVVTIDEAAAPAITQWMVLGILGIGTLVLAPAFAYLYLTFKGDVLFPGEED